jgi:type IV fimbrial biogenesis protein FimT
MKRRGFTLVELLVVLAVGSILLAIAVPGYAFMVNANRLAAVTNDLVTALHLARSEAIKRGTRVTVCKTGDAMAASPACSTTANWQDGWLVFVDGGTRGVVDGGDILLRVREQVSSGAVITSINYSRYISYLPGGGSQGSSGLANGSLKICRDSIQRDIIINRTGRPRLDSSTC